MGPSLSPDPIWNMYLSTMAWYFTIHLLIVLPTAYISIGRKFDKAYELKYYTIEKLAWFIGPGIRLTHYCLGILLQPYRNKRFKNKLVAELMKRRFTYQDKMYGKIVDFREVASTTQVFISYVYCFGFFAILLSAFLLIVHDFIIFPGISSAR